MFSPDRTDLLPNSFVPKPVASRTPNPDSVIDLIGNTPMMRMRRYLGRDDIALYAKLEAFNPGGSAKDSPARHMVEQALARCEISSSTTVGTRQLAPADFAILAKNEYSKLKSSD